METGETASPKLTEDGELLQKLQFKMATVTAKLREWHESATGIFEKPKEAKTDVVLQSGHWEAARDILKAQIVAAAEEWVQLSVTNPEIIAAVGKKW